jgi:hypothetical protein
MSQFTADELDELEKIAQAALPNSWAEHQKWRDETGYNNAGCPTRFFYIPEHNGDKTIELLEQTSQHIVAFQPEVALRLVAAARAQVKAEGQFQTLQDKFEELAALKMDTTDVEVLQAVLAMGRLRDKVRAFNENPEKNNKEAAKLMLQTSLEVVQHHRTTELSKDRTGSPLSEDDRIKLRGLIGDLKVEYKKMHEAFPDLEENPT